MHSTEFDAIYAALHESENEIKIVHPQNPHKDFPVTNTSVTSSRTTYDTKAVEAGIREKLKNPETNPAYKLANEYTKANTGKEYDFQKVVATSSREKQKSISDAFMMAASDTPGYKEAVFKAYQEKRPDIVDQLGAKDYDDLVQKSYHSLAHETDKQF